VLLKQTTVYRALLRSEEQLVCKIKIMTT